MNKKIIISLPISILEKIPKNHEDWIIEAITEKLDQILEPRILEERCSMLRNDNESSIEHDRCLYGKLYQELEPTGTIVRFLKDEDVGNLMWTKDLYTIYDFVDNWNHAQFEFLDPNIEECRKKFMESLVEVSDELKANTWLSHHDKNLSSMEAPDYDLNHPKWKKVDEINQLGMQTFRLYEDLIRILKKIWDPRLKTQNKIKNHQ